MKAIRVFDRETKRYILVTPWFDGSVKPARIGIYEREYPNGNYYSYWDGSRWGMGYATLGIVRQTLWPHIQDLPWRGLAEQPE